MASFYGNIKNNSRSSFIFDRIYNSRSQMEDALNNNIDPDTQQVIGDGVFINRYVLVNYSYSAEGAYVLIKKSQVNASNYDQYYYAVDDSNHTEYYDELTKKYYLPGNVYAKSNDVRQWENEAEVTSDYYQKTHFIDRFDINFHENPYYQKNRELDAGKYFASYDHTVWQKIYSDNQEKYILVAELNAEAPTFELITDAPDAMGGAPHFDLSLSSELNYVYHVPKNWGIMLNTYNPDILNEEMQQKIADLDRDDFSSDNEYNEAVGNIRAHPEQLHTYWYYEQDLLNKDKTFDIKEEYPFFNKRGFDKSVHVIKPVNEEGINLVDTKSLMEYPQHQYRPIELTIDTYVPNRYFELNTEAINEFASDEEEFDINKHYFIAKNDDEIIKLYKTCPLKRDYDGKKYLPAIQMVQQEEKIYVSDENPFVLATGDFKYNEDKTSTYYELTTVPIGEGERSLIHDKDTKRLDIYLPSIGNAIATLHDSIYGKPRYESRNIIGYTNKDILSNYNQSDFGGYEIERSQYSLEQEEVEELRIPVYNKYTGDLEGYITYKTFIEKYELNPDSKYVMLGNTYDVYPIYENSDNSFEPIGEISWDIPVYQLIDNIVGYTTADNTLLYTKDDEGPYKIENDRYNLTEDDINNLSPEMIPGSYDIPVYAYDNMNIRPYDDNKLFGTFAPPYDNITEEDNVSMGWALDTLKKYISELRYLSNGKNGELGNGLGLQSDWTLDDDQLFGYIYHKPDIITSFINSNDTRFIADKIYYEKKIDDNNQSNTYGYEFFEEVDVSKVDQETNNPSTLNLYEIPKTMTKNVETDFYREENIAGYVDSTEIAAFDEIYYENNKYFQEAINMHNPNLIYYKRIENTFVEEDFENLDMNEIYYNEVTELNRIFIINNLYYYISNEQINNLQKYADTKKTNEVIRLQTNFILGSGVYFIRNGSRYVQAYKTIGSYTFQPITPDQYANKCLCYFDRHQEIVVDNHQIIQRKYRFNSYGDTDANIYLTTGSFYDGVSEFADKRIQQFNIVIDASNMSEEEIKEFPMNDDFDIKIIENMSRRELVDYLLDNEVDHIFTIQTDDGDINLPYATVEILKVFNEDFSIYKNRNNNPFDFNQYVANTQQVNLDEEYWNKTRQNGVIYYLRDFKPVAQIDYEINTIWNSVSTDD